MRIILLSLLLVWNVVVFICYAVDKHKAKTRAWRIPEKVLILQALLAGGLGAFLAGKVCHHKTRKWYFWMAWMFGMLIDLGLLVLILRYV